MKAGDVLQLTMENSTLLARLRKTVVLEALKKIQQAFERSGINEEKLQEAGHRIRRKGARERYSVKA